jgi:hypothetical protein
MANEKEEDSGPKLQREEEKHPGRKGSIERVGKKTKPGYGMDSVSPLNVISERR